MVAGISSIPKRVRKSNLTKVSRDLLVSEARITTIERVRTRLERENYTSMSTAIRSLHTERPHISFQGKVNEDLSKRCRLPRLFY